MAKTYLGVIAEFDRLPKEIRDYFPEFTDLVETYPWEVSVNYMFSKIEQAKHMTIYCGIVKKHWCESTLTRKMVNEEYMSRGRFKELFKTVFGRKISKSVLEKLEVGESIRDKIAHGKNWSEKEAREGLMSTMAFAKEFNEFVFHLGGFKPFGKLKGFKGRAESLPKETTRWVLLGMGINKT
jgi:hypothetical protein